MQSTLSENQTYKVRGKPFVKNDPRAGRPKGSPGKVSNAIKKAYIETFLSLQDNPRTSLTAWAIRYPKEFYSFAARIIPDQVREALKITTNINENGV